MVEDERQRLLRIQPNLARRALIFQFVRDFFAGQGFLEVETPIRVPVVAPSSPRKQTSFPLPVKAGSSPPHPNST
ncbi:MAG: lysine aminoacylase GenX [Dehalococcoidales bacterium]|nr:lysine aminoacylase GenX [Dehalococcoidales bacterium]